MSGGNSVDPEIASDLVRAIKHEATFNLRQVATVAGSIMAGDGRSPFITALLAVDASLTIAAADGTTEVITLGNFVPFRKKLAAKRLITKIEIPLNVNLAYEYTARSPADLPIVCAALCCWQTGRTRLALGGFGKVPIMVFDGTENGGLKEAAEDAFSQAEDEWASSDYRKEIAGILAERCIARISENIK
jgi:CO/xanthine dehydrogenase FAD-binding subunit